jgi:hypothetical protein
MEEMKYILRQKKSHQTTCLIQQYSSSQAVQTSISNIEDSKVENTSIQQAYIHSDLGCLKVQVKHLQEAQCTTPMGNKRLIASKKRNKTLFRSIYLSY